MSKNGDANPVDRFLFKYEKLCKAHNLRLQANPFWGYDPDGGFKLFIKTSIVPYDIPKDEPEETKAPVPETKPAPKIEVASSLPKKS